MRNPFTSHPNSLGETYFQHLRHAMIFGTTMLMGGIACILHAFLPFVFKNTGSNLLLKLTRRFVDRMPVIEERVAVLSESIEKKKQNGTKLRVVS